MLVTQDPPNDGVLNTVGNLGVDATGVLGFDITPSGDAYAAVSVASMRMPATGIGTAVGSAGNGASLLVAALALGALAVAWGFRTRRV